MRSQLIVFLFVVLLLSACDDDEYSSKVKACFDFEFSETNEAEVQFFNCSENAITYFWDFGDGEISTQKDPVHTYLTQPPSMVTLIAKSRYGKDTLTRSLYGDIIAYKPNIYIYPEKETGLCLQIDFPLGGKVTESIPAYGDGWCFNVNPSGIIDNRYSYLFYESKQPDIFQYEKGWCVEGSDLKSFFEDNMSGYNFSEQEIKDFTDYWIPLLTEDKYYLIYPQTNETINTVISFDFSEQPDHLGRLFYAIVGVNCYQQLEEPLVTAFVRSGFFVLEWGVIRK